MHRPALLAVAVAALALAQPSVRAAQLTPLTLPTLNADIRTWTAGADYAPLFPSTTAFNGVPFELVVDGAGHTAFNTGTLDIDVGLQGPSRV
jgi:hypothetical protein